MEKVKEIWMGNKKALIALAVVAVVYVGYIFLSGGEETEELSLEYSPVADSYETGLGQSILRTLSTLRAIELDTSIFDNPIFRSLADHGVATTSIPLGRIDPFAPIQEVSDI